MQVRTGVLVVMAVLVAMSVGPLSGTVAAQEGGQSIELEMTVTESGEVDTVDLNQTVTEQQYEQMLSFAESQGYDSVSEQLADQLVEQGTIYHEYSEAEDRKVEGGYTIDVFFTGVTADGFPSQQITAEDESVSLVWDDVQDPADSDDIDEVTYVVDMPYEIADSNAQSIDDTVVTWELHENTPETLFVDSEVVSDDEADDTVVEEDDSDDESTENDSDDNGADDGLPGFGPVIAVVGLLAATMLVVHNQD